MQVRLGRSEAGKLSSKLRSISALAAIPPAAPTAISEAAVFDAIIGSLSLWGCAIRTESRIGMIGAGFNAFPAPD